MVFKALINFIRVVRQNGGVRGSLWAIFVRDDLKGGKLVGEDAFGNKYYENNKYFFGRNRWVNYADHVFLDYDASQVAPEWSGWLHYRTDRLPHEDPTRPKYPWMSPHQENMTGTNEQYVPWSTTRPKIHAWQPPRCDKDPGEGTSCSGREEAPRERICCDVPVTPTRPKILPWKLPRTGLKEGTSCPGRGEAPKGKLCSDDSKKKAKRDPCEKPVKAFH